MSLVQVPSPRFSQFNVAITINRLTVVSESTSSTSVQHLRVVSIPTVLLFRFHIHIANLIILLVVVFFFNNIHTLIVLSACNQCP